MAQKSRSRPDSRPDLHCPTCGTVESQTPGGKARRAIDAAQSAKMQAQRERAEAALRRAMTPSVGAGLPAQGMPVRAGVGSGVGSRAVGSRVTGPGVTDPREALLRAILMRNGR